jgi:hypothetical protein
MGWGVPLNRRPLRDIRYHGAQSRFHTYGDRITFKRRDGQRQCLQWVESCHPSRDAARERRCHHPETSRLGCSHRLATNGTTAQPLSAFT